MPRRFERIHDVVEPVEQYRAKGYHPVHLEDTFNQRFQIVGKWGYGSFSTVWLARDQSLQKYVSLKILTARASKQNRELSILLSLSESSSEHPGRNHVIPLLDHFEHDGPNGKHLCLVFPVMLSDGQSMTFKSKPRHADYIRAVSKQILLGLDFLHEQGLVHTDLQPANILFSVDSIPPMEVLTPPEFSPVKWLPGIQADDSAPRYLMVTQRPWGTLDDADVPALEVKICDLGGAIPSGQQDVLPVTPTGLRAPELLEKGAWDNKIDIWTLGCLIFQLVTNEPLFPLGMFGLTADKVKQDLRSLMNEFFANGSQGFSVYLSERLPPDFGAENLTQLTSFLWSMLQRDPQDRKTTTELLNDSFLTE
ncbi:serine protein kinase [Xylona heveae TC161]|uniref:non-specific serine/threonine protein kinase n=1 Tax=Xylona heveae (strain CBS 132557 / TC161) TaxID=1328760 RepID=A0A165HVL7_XYLHT|nr:serine protein kinase [Xylona heveae TC161]KZF23983.1 serine protein kinase [Xylona heveae TC161]